MACPAGFEPAMCVRTPVLETGAIPVRRRTYKSQSWPGGGDKPHPSQESGTNGVSCFAYPYPLDRRGNETRQYKV